MLFPLICALRLEVPMGQQVEVFYTPSDDGWYFIAKRADKTAFECYLELEPVKQ